MCESDERKPEQIREGRYRTEADPAAPSRVVTITPPCDTGTALAGRRDIAPTRRSHGHILGQRTRYPLLHGKQRRADRFRLPRPPDQTRPNRVSIRMTRQRAMA